VSVIGIVSCFFHFARFQGKNFAHFRGNERKYRTWEKDGKSANARPSGDKC
jgi:hypothetical protein